MLDTRPRPAPCLPAPQRQAEEQAAAKGDAGARLYQLEQQLDAERARIGRLQARALSLFAAAGGAAHAAGMHCRGLGAACRCAASHPPVPLFLPCLQEEAEQAEAAARQAEARYADLAQQLEAESSRSASLEVRGGGIFEGGLGAAGAASAAAGRPVALHCACSRQPPNRTRPSPLTAAPSSPHLHHLPQKQALRTASQLAEAEARQRELDGRLREEQHRGARWEAEAREAGAARAQAEARLAEALDALRAERQHSASLEVRKGP